MELNFSLAAFSIAAITYEFGLNRLPQYDYCGGAAIEERRSSRFYCGARGAIEDEAPQFERFYTVPKITPQKITFS